MNTFYKISNYSVGLLSVAALGYLGYMCGSSLYGQCDRAFPAAVVAFGIVGVLVFGFLALESRTM